MNILRKTKFVFDAFGTLFSIQLPLSQLENLAGGQAAALLDLWRRKQLEYSWLRGQMGKYVGFDQITLEALTYAKAQLGLSDPAIDEILLPVYLHPDLLPGAYQVLQHLHQMGMQNYILSNGTMEMLETGVRKTKVAPFFTQLLSVESIQTFKPHPSVYQMALDQLAAKREELVFISSNQWDISGASTFGLDCIWVNTAGAMREELPFGEVTEVKNLLSIIE